MDHGQGEGGSDGRVDRVASRHQHLDADLRGDRVLRHDHPVARANGYAAALEQERCGERKDEGEPQGLHGASEE